MAGPTIIAVIEEMPIHTLSLELVEAISREYEDLEALNLSENRISRIENLHLLPSLTKLDLSSNSITRVENLQSCYALVELRLNNNAICGIDSGLTKLERLELLDLRDNRLADVKDVSRIAGQLPALRDLSLAGNPCALQQHYKATIASSCQSLKLLDGAPLAAVVVGTDVVWPLPLGVNFERNNTQQRLVEGGQEIPAGVRQPLLAGCSTAPANRTEALDYPNNGVEPAAPSDPRPSRWLSSASDGPLKPASLTAAKDLVSPAPLENFRDGAVGRPALPQVLQAFGSQAERWPASEAGVRHPPRAVASQQPEDPFDNSKRFVEDEARAEGPSDRLKNRQHECGAGGGSQTVHKPRYGSEIQRARDMLSEALADADGQRRLAEERKAELEVATQKVVEAERSLSSLRAYIGVMAGKGGGSEGCPQVQEAGVQADERSDDGAVMEKELLGQQLAAMREIVAVQEEHMAVGGDGLLERWRQEVFKCIVARRASEVRLDEEVRTAKAREARLREELRKTNCAVQVAQHKITSLEAELQLAKAWTAAARKDADEAQKGLSEWEAQARLLYGQLMQVARQADEGAMSLEKELKGQAKNLVAFSRRVGFAEERLKGFAETVLARLTSPQQRAEAERHIQELSARCKALQAEKLTLLEKLDKVKQEAETIGVEAQERAAGELRLALKEQEAHLARRWEEMESALRAELAATVEECERREAEAARSCRDADRDLRTTRTKLVEQEAKASELQANLADCEAKLQEAAATLASLESRLHAAQEDAKTSLRRAEERHVDEVAALKAEHEADRREAAKAIVTVRQLERQVARLHEKQSSDSAAETAAMEHKLREKDAALRAARRERNALLAAQRGTVGQDPGAAPCREVSESPCGATAVGRPGGGRDATSSRRGAASPPQRLARGPAGAADIARPGSAARHRSPGRPPGPTREARLDHGTFLPSGQPQMGGPATDSAGTGRGWEGGDGTWTARERSGDDARASQTDLLCRLADLERLTETLLSDG